ncbi:MAG: Ig-like domain-containing protein [Pseudohongiellaceae bacterium]
MSAKNKSNKKFGGAGEDSQSGSDTNDRVDGKSGNDEVSGGGGDDWVKGGSGDDVLRYSVTDNFDSTDLYDGGAGVDSLLLKMSFDEWMRLDIQNDIAAYLVWLPAHLNPKGTATGQTFAFSAFDLDARKLENVRVTVDGVELNPEDEAVTLAADSFSFDEDRLTVAGNVLLNDDVPDLVRSVELIDAPAIGDVAIEVSGDFTYGYGDSFQHLAVGESATQSFSYRVVDADLDEQITTVTIEITGVNDAPVAAADTGATLENAALTVDVLANDTDIDSSDTHTVDQVAVTDDGRAGAPTAEPAPTVSIHHNQLVFDPGTAYDYLSRNETATAVVEYQMSDNNGGTDSSTVTVTITGTNDRPVATADIATVDEDSAVTIDALANDYDVDQSDTIAITAVTQSPHGGLATIVDGSIVFDTQGDFETLAADESETITLGYEIADNNGATHTAEIDMTVTGVNDAPEANDDTAAITENQSRTVAVLANDTDIDASDVHTVDAALLLTDGRPAFAPGAMPAVSVANDKVSFNPGDAYDYLAVGESTTATIRYVMSDDKGGIDSANLTIEITGTNDRPVAEGDSGTVAEDGELVLDVLANDSDVDQSDTLSVVEVGFAAPNLDGSVRIENGTVVYDTEGSFEHLGAGETSTIDIYYVIQDSVGADAAAPITVTVEGVNDAPTAAMDEASTTESGSVLIDVLANDTDIDANDTLSINNVSVVYGEGSASIENGQIRFNTNGQYESLGVNQQAEAVVEYTITDDQGATSTSAAFVTISGEYDAPIVVDSLSGYEFESMTVEYASDWHLARLDETGSATGLQLHGGWRSNWEMGIQNQSLFGLDPSEELRADVTGGFDVDTGRVNLISLDALWEDIDSGAEFSGGFEAEFGVDITPYVSVDGGSISSVYGLNGQLLNTTTDSNGFSRFLTRVDTTSNSSIDFDMPDSYNAGIDASISARFGLFADARGAVFGEELFTWDYDEDLFDVAEDFNLIEAGIDTKDGGVTLSVLESSPITLINQLSLPKGIGQIKFYDESTETYTAGGFGEAIIAEGTQPIAGIRFDFDDILGNLPKVGKVFENLDNKLKLSVGSLGGVELGYTFMGAGFSFDLALDATSAAVSDHTVDLLFDKPVYVEGFTDPVMAIRNADWLNLPGIKSMDGSPVTAMPLFNSQLQLGTGLSLDLVGNFDYTIGAIDARVWVDGVFDESLSLGPLASDIIEVFQVELIGLSNIDYGSTGYDQFAGSTFMVA